MKRLLLALLLPFSASAVDCWKLGGVTIIPTLGGAAPTIGSTIGGIAGCSAFGGINVVVDTEVATWRTGIGTAFGASTPNLKSISIAQNLIMALKASAYNSKIVYLLPFLGQDLVAARMPLRDSLGKGIADALGDINNGAFSEATGVQGNGSSKGLGTLVLPSELGTSNNGGLGYWENNVSFSGNTEPIGCYGVTSRFIIVGHASARGGCWGSPATAYATQAVAMANGHQYWERSSSTSREFFVEGVSVATDTDSDTALDANTRTIYVLARNYVTVDYWAGRCGCAYFTDGTMGATNIAAFDALLRTWLFTPTGRPSS